MADKCDSIRSRLRDLEVELKDSQSTPGDIPVSKPPPHLNALVREIAQTRLSLQACVESLLARQWTVTG